MPIKAWIIAADMGYGHGRAAHPLRTLSPTGEVINANNYEGIPAKDAAYWERVRQSYEFISRFRRVPILGGIAFGVMDRFQKIKTYRPNEKDTAPTVQLKQTYAAIKKGLGKHLIDTLNAKPLPLVTTFFTAAYMAEEHGYQGDIYLVACDSDVSRAWAPLKPATSRIQYCAPTEHVANRLKTYGVRSEQIHITGFPLPIENIGSRKEIIKHDLARRLKNLDPYGLHAEEYDDLVRKDGEDRPLTITFAVGGAGAQTEIVPVILQSLKEELRKDTIRLQLVAGVRGEVRDFFKKYCETNGFGVLLGKSIFINYFENKNHYFNGFNELLHTTDILWTKPSELVFYAGLGIPIVMAPALGSQEDANQAWLQSAGAGVMQCAPERTHEWLVEWIESGVLAPTALNGYKHGNLDAVKTITKLISA